MGEKIFVAFSDDGETAITGVFCCSQSPDVYPFQGTVTAGDTRYAAWYGAHPSQIQNTWPCPQPDGGK